LLVF
jgi:hypothetical protein